MGNIHSLHIGLNKVNPKNYAGWDGKLTGCINDAKYMKSVIKATGFSELLTDKKATYENFEKALLYIAQLSTNSDKTFITFSGHGASVPDRNGDETDKLDETICLYNGMVLDDTFSRLLDIISGKIYVFSDSCHSGTNTKEMLYGIPKGKAKVIKDIDMSKVVVKSAGVLSNKNPNILAIGACQDNQVSYDLGKHGAFTESIIKIYEKEKKINYENLVKKSIETLQGSQTPKLNTYRGDAIKNDIVFV